MFKQLCCLFVLVALANSAPAPVQETFKELPCLNKVAGQRLPHPTDTHKFLRCVTVDTVWIETCPDNLFFNPHSSVCDWDMLEKVTTSTTAAPEIKERPVLVKFIPKTGATVEQVVMHESNQRIVGQDLLTTSTVHTPVVEAITPIVESITTPVTVQPVVEMMMTTTPAAQFVIEQTTTQFVESTTPFNTFVVPTTEMLQTEVKPSMDINRPLVFETTTTVAMPTMPIMTTTMPATAPVFTEHVVEATTTVSPVVFPTTTLEVLRMPNNSF